MATAPDARLSTGIVNDPHLSYNLYLTLTRLVSLYPQINIGTEANLKVDVIVYAIERTCGRIRIAKPDMSGHVNRAAEYCVRSKTTAPNK